MFEPSIESISFTSSESNLLTTTHSSFLGLDPLAGQLPQDQLSLSSSFDVAQFNQKLAVLQTGQEILSRQDIVVSDTLVTGMSADDSLARTRITYQHKHSAHGLFEAA